jgi:arginyl-tRNA synthetase
MSSRSRWRGPGFLNFCVDERWLHEVLRAAAVEGEAGFARPRFGEGERVQVEFVSANPTGPVHVGNDWWASYGDAVARLLERCGYSVQREYYINDTGGQVRRLGASVLSHRAGQPVPEDGYPSGFIKMEMTKVNISFDSWYSQRAIEESEAVADTVAFLTERGLVFEEDGAVWLSTGEFGDPRKKRVLRKSNGDYTYLAGDGIRGVLEQNTGLRCRGGRRGSSRGPKSLLEEEKSVTHMAVRPRAAASPKWRPSRLGSTHLGSA